MSLRSRRIATAASLAIVVGVGAGWNAPEGGPRDRPSGHVAGTEAIEERRCRDARPRPLGSRRIAYAAVARGRVTAYRRPGGRAVASFGAVNANRYPTVFGVVGVARSRNCRSPWYRVKLPRRPNGGVAYVRADDVNVGRVTTRIEVDLSLRRLTLLRAGRRVFSARVAVGAPSTPTPMGRFYVDQRLLSGDPSGPYGPAALGIAAFSEVLTGWTQGGPIGIHGTDDPSSIGRSASNGCLRLRNDALRRLFRLTPAGTPVVVHP